ncbi:hypothetical protein, partial [Pseudomonas fluorescens]|uniref:hypothetical protein n=1 Tax=Pseudomonas fluorescens TaxID=294 RepID=UPI000A5A9334
SSLRSASVFDGAPEIKIKSQSNSNSARASSCVDTHAPTREYQHTQLWLTHRHREQAPSHIF